MIHCSKVSFGQLVKIFGIVQVVLAIVVTSVGIAVTVKFRHVHHETPTEHALDYVDNPWTTVYGAGIWMGMIILTAGVIGSLADVKPEKSKLTYSAIIMNLLVSVFSLVLIIFSAKAISWYQSCKYTVIHKVNANKYTKNCSSEDKTTGQELYWALLITTIIVLPVTITTIVCIVIKNAILFQDCFNRGCFRKMVYKAKGGGNTFISFKTKNMQEFDQVMVNPAPFSESTAAVV